MQKTARKTDPFVDVDGVISLFGFSAGEPPGVFHQIDGIVHCIGAMPAERLKRLAERIELVWATGWEEKANEYLPRLLELDSRDLPVITFDGRAVFGTAHWKVDAIDEYARDRPAAWIDDNLDGPATHGRRGVHRPPCWSRPRRPSASRRSMSSRCWDWLTRPREATGCARLTGAGSGSAPLRWPVFGVGGEGAARGDRAVPPLPAAAGAASVRVEAGEVVFQGTPGEANDVTVDPGRVGSATPARRSRRAPAAAGHLSPARPSATGSSAGRFSLATATIGSPSRTPRWPPSFDVEGGDGADTVATPSAARRWTAARARTSSAR